MGDLHQPLHVGVQFINVDGENGEIEFEIDPDTILENEFPSDIGGNKLLIKGEESDNLHSFGDADLVDQAMGNQTLTEFAESLTPLAVPAWNSSGSFST